MVEPATIITIICVVFLCVERLAKRVKRSQCCGNSSVEFNTEGSVPDLTTYLKR